MNVGKDFICKNYKESKNGIYFLYNEEGTIVYVEKVGNGSHCSKIWFNNIKKFRFKSFPNLNSEEINKIERLMIYAKKQPAFNDCYTTKDEYESIASKL